MNDIIKNGYKIILAILEQKDTSDRVKLELDLTEEELQDIYFHFEKVLYEESLKVRDLARNTRKGD